MRKKNQKSNNRMVVDMSWESEKKNLSKLFSISKQWTLDNCLPSSISSETIHLRLQQSDQILILGFSAEKIQGKPYNNNVYQWCTHHWYDQYFFLKIFKWSKQVSNLNLQVIYVILIIIIIVSIIEMRKKNCNLSRVYCPLMAVFFL